MSFVEGNLQLGIELAPGTLDRLKSQISQIEKGATARVNIDPTPINRASESVRKLDQQAVRTGNTITQKLGGAAKSVGATLGTLAAVGGAGLVALGTKAILAGKEFNILQQQVRAGLTAVLGTSKAAEGLLAQVNKLNDTSPFPRSSFLAATQQLVGFGVEAQKVVPILDSIQNAVAGIGGDANDIAMFTNAFAQIKSQGRLTGDVLFSLGSKGVDAAAIIGQQMGKTGQQIKDEVSKGAIGADQAIDLLTKGLTEKFKGATDNVAKSFLGAKDRVTARLRDIGAALTSAFITPTGGGAAVDGLNNIANGLKAIREIAKSAEIQAMMRQLGNLFVDGTKQFQKFAESLKSDQIVKILDIFRQLSPVIAFFGTTLLKNVGGNIPFIGRFITALNPMTLAIVSLVATIPSVRDGFMQIIDALTPVAEALLPALDSALKAATGSATALAPILTTIAGAISAIATVITPVFKLLDFKPVQAALLVVAANFLITKIAGTSAFQEIALRALYAGEAVVGVGQQALATGGKLAAMGAAGKAAMGGVGSAILGIVNPTNLAFAALAAVTLELNRSKASAQAMADAITKGLDINRPSDQAKAQAEIDKKRQEAAEKLAKSQAQIAALSKTHIIGPQPVLRFFAKNDEKNAKKELDKLEKQLSDIKDRQKEVSQGIIAQLSNTEWAGQFDTIDEAFKAATEAGIDFINLRPDKVNDAVDTVIKKIKEVPAVLQDTFGAKLTQALTPTADALDKITAAQDKVKSSSKALEDAQRHLDDVSRVTAQDLEDKVTKAQLSLDSAQIRAARSADRMTSAQIALAQAQRGVEQAIRAETQATQKLADLERQRSQLLRDVNNEAREMARANAALASTQQQLIDLDEREADLLREREDLADEGPDKIAAADRSIERARIALNNATREELELQRELNHENDITVDLAGASVDEIKSRLAGARAQMAAQRAVSKSKKTQQQIDDELETAALNKVDAEYALKQAIEARGDTEADLAIAKRENEEAINQIAVDRAELLRQQEEKQIDINNLIEAGSTKSRTLRDLNDEIADAVDGVKSAHERVIESQITVRDREDDIKQAVIDAKNEVINLRDEQRNVRDAAREARDHQRELREATENVRDRQREARDAAIAYKEAIATAKGDNDAINGLLWDRIGLNAQLLAQNPEVATKLAQSIAGQFPEIGAFGETREWIANRVLDFILNNPGGLMQFLKGLQQGLADGGIVTQHTFTQVGEGGKPEVVLPLTKPSRSMTLLAQSIPYMHTALQKQIAPMFAPRSAATIQLPSVSPQNARYTGSANPTGSGAYVNKKDGPATYGQMMELIELLKELNSKEYLHVDAPTTVVSGPNEDIIERRITRKIEKQINEIMRRR